MIAALYVARNGSYFGLPNVDPWDETRDARRYAGPLPIVAHPPCTRWCRLAGLVEARWGHRRGEDGGLFAAALASVRLWGGVLEHPAYSDAWAAHGLAAPATGGVWTPADTEGGWTCYVEQCRYGHRARKATWLYACGTDLPQLRWGKSTSASALVSWCGNHTHDRRPRLTAKEAKATPPEFRDTLIGIAMTARQTNETGECRYCGYPCSFDRPVCRSFRCTARHNGLDYSIFPETNGDDMERSDTSQSQEFYTPKQIVEATRRTLMAIDLDPASCARAQQVVQAKRFFSRDDNGLARDDWTGRIFLNPPGGEVPSSLQVPTRSSQALWWLKLAAHYMARQVTAAVFVCYSIEVLSRAQKPSRAIGVPSPLAFPLCIPEQRIAFDVPSPDGSRIGTSSPKYGNAIIFLPALGTGEDLDSQIDRFAQAFADIGDVARGDGERLRTMVWEAS